MSDTSAGNGQENGQENGRDQAQGDAGQQGQPLQPQIQINAQYVKDLSFENPGAPQTLFGEGQPGIEVSVDVGGRGLGGDRYEVELRITAQASRGEQRVFVVETLYGGVFTITNVPQDALKPVCLIECPRILFPFARRVIADATRDGGFAPLLLDPIDFVALYMHSEQNQQMTEQPGDESA